MQSPLLLIPDIRPASLHNSSARLFLSTARFMAIGGVEDAQPASLMLAHFGRNYRRPLVLMRALMLEIARISRRTIMMAPPCCARMTADEALMLSALRRDEGDTLRAHEDCCALLGREDALGPLTCFQAVAQCFEDLGQPVR